MKLKFNNPITYRKRKHEDGNSQLFIDLPIIPSILLYKSKKSIHLEIIFLCFLFEYHKDK